MTTTGASARPCMARAAADDRSERRRRRLLVRGIGKIRSARVEGDGQHCFPAAVGKVRYACNLDSAEGLGIGAPALAVVGYHAG
jgi:hypothetical protein